MLLYEGGEVGAIVSKDACLRARFDCAGPGRAEDVANLAEYGSGVDEHIEHDVVLVDFDGPFFQNVEAFALASLLEDRLAGSKLFNGLHAEYFILSGALWQVDACAGMGNGIALTTINADLTH